MKKLYVGTQNDGLFVIDKSPRPAPTDYITEGGDTNVIAVMSGSSTEDQQLAYLFAAAPDLLEAAQALEDAELAWANCSECNGEDMPEACPKCFPAHDKARVLRRAALARARGEEQ